MPAGEGDNDRTRGRAWLIRSPHGATSIGYQLENGVVAEHTLRHAKDPDAVQLLDKLSPDEIDELLALSDREIRRRRR